MAKKQSKEPVKEDEKVEKLSIPAQVQQAISGAAKMLGVAVGELWSIFVRQYIVRGLSELFTGVVFVGLGIYLEPHIGLWNLAVMAPALFFFYGSIQLLGNPKYYAIEDIMKKVRQFRKETIEKEIDKKTNPRNYF